MSTTYKTENRHYNLKSSAIRAAKSDGLGVDQIDLHQDGAEWYWTRKTTESESLVEMIEETEVETTEIEHREDAIKEMVAEVMAETTMVLVDDNGTEYGTVPLTKAHDAAGRLADDMGVAITAQEDDMYRDPDNEIADIVVEPQSRIESSDQIEITDEDDTSDDTKLRVLRLVATDGSSYGDVAETDAEDMAIRLANSENCRMMVINPDTASIVLSVDPHPVEDTNETTDAEVQDGETTEPEATDDQTTDDAQEPAQDSLHVTLDSNGITITVKGPVETGTETTTETDMPDEVAIAFVVKGSQAHDIAHRVMKMFRTDAHMAHPDTMAYLGTVVHDKVRPMVSKPANDTKKAGKGRSGLPNEGTNDRRIIDLAMRETGTTKAEVLNMLGWKQIPGDIFTKVAEKYGLELIISKDGRIAHYFMMRPEIEETKLAAD